MYEYSAVAPAFFEMAHRIIWCVAATTKPDGRARTRVLHPIWEWDGKTLTGWIGTDRHSPKSRDLASTPFVSLTYWEPSQDTCTADCETAWETDPEVRAAGWNLFSKYPPPLGYDPSAIPGWDDSDSPNFGLVRLTPRRLVVTPGTEVLSGNFILMNWQDTAKAA